MSSRFTVSKPKPRPASLQPAPQTVVHGRTAVLTVANPATLLAPYPNCHRCSYTRAQDILQEQVLAANFTLFRPCKSDAASLYDSQGFSPGKTDVLSPAAHPAMAISKGKVTVAGDTTGGM